MTDLKPCPFCEGAASQITFSVGEYWVSCNCGASTEMCSIESNAVKAWNTRPKEDKLLAERKADKDRIAELEDELLDTGKELLAKAGEVITLESQLAASNERNKELERLIAAAEEVGTNLVLELAASKEREAVLEAKLGQVADYATTMSVCGGRGSNDTTAALLHCGARINQILSDTSRPISVVACRACSTCGGTLQPDSTSTKCHRKGCPGDYVSACLIVLENQKETK